MKIVLNRLEIFKRRCIVCPVTESSNQPQGDLKMPNANYKTLTVRDLVNIVNADKHFPNGLDTPIATGDFEGNYHHILHEVFHGDKVGKNPAILLCYEMHESDGNL